jgi:general secretion pathway protein J
MNRQQGYTLLELLVAMLLLSIIGVIIAGGLQFGTAVWSRTEGAIADTSEIDEAHSILRTVLAQAVPVRRDGLVTFDGEPARAAFESPAPQALRAGGLAHMEIVAEPDKDGGLLVIRVSSPGDAPREITLARKIGSVRFSYLDASERIPVWLAVWRDRMRLPDAVRLEQESASGPWTTLIVHPKIAQSAACDYDPESASCRD